MKGNTRVPEMSQGGVEPAGGGGQVSRDAELSRIPAPHSLKQERLQLAGVSFVTRCVSKAIGLSLRTLLLE